ncbi:MAG: hypothetical protein GKR93_02555 [Gammaproteobacteria bacterium]|nr:hypothetical protein [Gammaproteobacteria bacterium]
MSWLEERPGVSRIKAALGLGVLAWLLGIVFILSFNHWKDVKPLAGLPLFDDKNLFGIIDLIVANLMLPLNAMLIAIFAGWMLSTSITRKEIGASEDIIYRCWLWTVRVLAPIAILVVLIISLRQV